MFIYSAHLNKVYLFKVSMDNLRAPDSIALMKLRLVTLISPKGNNNDYIFYIIV